MRILTYTISLLALCFSLNVSAGNFPGILICDDGNKRVAVFNSSETLLWEYPCPKPYDVHLLDDNTLLIATGKGVQRITTGKKILMNYEAQGEMYSALPLDDGSILAINTTRAVVLKLDKNGKVLQTIHLKGKKGHTGSRILRVSSDSSFLVGHASEGLAREYDYKGNVLAEFKTTDFVYEALRLKNGNTLVSYKEGIMEFNTQGKVVRSLKQNMFPDQEIAFFTCIQELPNGNLLAGNWLGHGKHCTGIPFIEIDKNNKVVWSFNDNKQVLQATAIVPITDSQLELFKPKQKQQ